MSGNKYERGKSYGVIPQNIMVISKTCDSSILTASFENVRRGTVLVRGARLGWANVVMEMFKHARTDGVVISPPIDVTAVYMQTSTAPIRVLRETTSLKEHTMYRRGTIGLIPRRHGESYKNEDEQIVVVMLLSDDLLEEAAHGLYGDRCADAKTIKWGTIANDYVLSNTLSLVEGELSSAGDSGTLFGEALAVAVAARLVQHHSHATTRRVTREPERLPKWKIERACRFIKEHLAENATLAEIASNAGLSRFHFARAFRHAVGVSPGAYQMLCRVEKAKELMASTSLSIMDIALAVGYKGQSQFGAMFKRATGITPTKYLSGVRNRRE